MEGEWNYLRDDLWSASQMNRLFVPTSLPFWLLDDMSILEPTRTGISDSSLMSWSPYSPNGTT